MGTIQPTNYGINLDRLTDKERAFVLEYVISFNGADAARKAGYSIKTASVLAVKLLHKKHIQRAVGKLLQERIWRCEIDADRVLTELAAVGFFDPLDLFDEEGTLLSIHNMPEHARRAIGSFEVSVREEVDEDGSVIATTTLAKVKLNNKISALELIGKHLAMFDERFKVDHNHSIDWSALFNGRVPDAIEGKIEGEDE